VRFLADESCDFGVVTALRAVGHDVIAIVEINPGSEDESVLRMAYSESRVLLTETRISACSRMPVGRRRPESY
jgi:hypothetical protein